jgi:DNA repair photolyase
VALITKNQLVTRDIDLLSELARHKAAAVFISLTTLDTKLRAVMEPRTSPPTARLSAIQALASAGIPVGVLVSPVIPGLNDHEIPSILEAAAEAEATAASYVILRLPHAVAPLFEQWLATHVPEKRDKILNRIRAVRQGKLTESAFGKRMRGQGIFAEQIHSLFKVALRKSKLAKEMPELSTAAFRRVGDHQPELALE